MTRLHGRSPVGIRCHDHAPDGHWKTTTFVGALRPAGMTAPFVLDGLMDGDAFGVYVREMRTPTLADGDIVVMDNLPRHKVEGVRALVEATGATLWYLPRYSPDFNPIEQAVANLKALLQKAAARSVEAIRNAIGAIVNSFTAEECTNYFASSGYALQLNAKCSRSCSFSFAMPVFDGAVRTPRSFSPEICCRRSRKLWKAGSRG